MDFELAKINELGSFDCLIFNNRNCVNFKLFSVWKFDYKAIVKEILYK
jgi:hypothetical protein